MSPSELFPCGCDAISGQCPKHERMNAADAANARLIAAAPRMKNALEHLVARPDLLTDPIYVDQLRAILRDVEVESNG